MGWEPITITEEHIHGFAKGAAALSDELDDRGKLMWRTIIDRAGGDGHHQDSSEPATGRYGKRSNGGNGSSGKQETALEHFSQMLRSIWEPGTTIAPLNSGDMPREGGGTID